MRQIKDHKASEIKKKLEMLKSGMQVSKFLTASSESLLTQVTGLQSLMAMEANMNKMNIRGVFIVSFLSLGFFSCGKDKNPSQDNFRVETPIVHAQFKSKTTGAGSNLFLLDTKLDKGFLPTSEIEFSSLKKIDFSKDPIRVVFLSQCTLSGETLPSQIYKKQLMNVSSLNFLNILDPFLIVEATTSQKSLSCALTIELTNKNGSTDKFNFKDLFLEPTNLTDQDGLEIMNLDENGQIHNPSEPILEENRSKNKHFGIINNTKLQYYSSKDETASLICENFIAEKINLANSELLLSSLTHAKVIRLKKVDQAKDVDPRVSRPTQNCQIHIERGDSTKSMTYSRIFKFVFKTGEPIITSEIQPNFFTKGTPGRRLNAGEIFEVFHLSISNSTEYPITLWIHEVRLGAEATALNFPGQFGYFESANIIVTNATEIAQSAQPGKLITIVPGAVATISFQTKLPSVCEYVIPRPEEPNYPHAHDYTFVYMRSSNVLISQLANPILENDPLNFESFREYNEADISHLPTASWKSEGAPNLLCHTFNAITF